MTKPMFASTIFSFSVKTDIAARARDKTVWYQQVIDIRVLRDENVTYIIDHALQFYLLCILIH